jgi:hypothetical protein
VLVLGALTACSGTPESREPARFETTTQVGGLDVDSGFEDRLVAQTSANLLLPSGAGVHLDVVGEEREEDAVFTAAGVSYRTENFRPKLRLGTSTENENIQPEIFAEFELGYISDPEDGYTLTPLVSYRKYRNTAEETALGLSATRYFDAQGDRLWIAQAFGRGTYADPGSNLGFSAGGSLAYSKYDTWSIGLLAEAGRSRYDSVLGAGSVENDFYSLRPFGSIRISDNAELFARLEYYNTEVYDALGGFLGVKFTFDLFGAGSRGGAQ